MEGEEEDAGPRSAKGPGAAAKDKSHVNQNADMANREHTNYSGAIDTEQSLLDIKNTDAFIRNSN